LHGLGERESVALLSAFFLGQCVFAWHLGSLVDNGSPRRAVLLLSVGAAALSIAIPLLVGGTLGLIAVGMWGAFLNAFRSTTGAILGQNLSGTSLVVASSLYVVLANGGEILGPPLAGILMDLFGANAMISLVFVTAGMSAVIAMYLATSQGVSSLVEVEGGKK
jgi:MFS family permease